MLISNILFSMSLDIFLLFDAEIQGIFFDWIRLSSHGALISGNFICVDQDSVGWYIHSLVYSYQIAN